ncbi:MAG: hypothetical protein OEL54_03355, partial [Flavobacteriaceae bacterium]|nr:hypothetical protein [Flavobacteriaceae bacterium]
MISRFVIYSFMIIPMLIIATKIFFLGYMPNLIIPEKNFNVNIYLTGNSQKDNISLKTFLPTNNFRQKIYNESYDKTGFDFAITPNDINKQAIWRAYESVGKFNVNYQFSVSSKAVTWNIPQDLSLDDYSPVNLENYLKSTEMMPLNDPN